MILSVNQLEGNVTEYITDKAIVRIHQGKLTEEKRKAVFEDAAKEFFKAIQKSGGRVGTIGSACADGVGSVRNVCSLSESGNESRSAG